MRQRTVASCPGGDSAGPPSGRPPPSEHSVLPRRLHREGIHPEITLPEPRPKSLMGGSWQCDQGHLGGHQLDDPLAGPVAAPLPDSPTGPWAWGSPGEGRLVLGSETQGASRWAPGVVVIPCSLLLLEI